MNRTRQITWTILVSVLALSGCVREEEALTDDPSGEPGPNNNPPAALAITPPPDSNNEATGQMTAVDIGQASASGGDGSYTFSNDAPAAGFGLGATAVGWTVSDGAGATASGTQTITVVDTTAPTIQQPADMQVAATGPLTMVDIGAATATDLVDPGPAVSNDMPANGFPEGTTPVTWAAVDSSGNTSTATQMVTVAAASAGPLTLAAPADISSEATAPQSAVMLGVAMASGGEPPVTIVNDAPANGFAVGVANVTWTATDSTMAVATAVQQVEITDTTPPQLVVPSDIVADQGPGLGNTDVSFGTATATDVADPAPVITNDAPANGFPVGSTTIVWTATDAHGNSTSANQTVTVNAYVAELCSALEPDFANIVYPILDSANPLRCNGCHTGGNPLATPNGFAFPNDPPTSDDLEVFRTVSLIDSGNESLVTVKARGGASHAGGDRF
ncbi:MAG: HYR domain-containing protein, partial [Gammaproteobacteria bacterium]|nr:HYR domain-containing protein [Gammaproteobacteria bacterium]